MLLPTRDDLDDELLTKLVDAIARKWGVAGVELDAQEFMQVVTAYAAVRHLNVIKGIHDQLARIDTAIRGLDETILGMLSELPTDEEEEGDEGQSG